MDALDIPTVYTRYLFSKCAMLESCGRSSAVMATANTMLSTCDALSSFHILDD